MNLLFALFSMLFLQGCSGVCRGIYIELDDSGALKKFNEVAAPSGMSGCVTNTIPLSNWETSYERMTSEGKPCVPQPQFSARSLGAANNFYTYRNDRLYLDLDSTTGVYRRLTLGENASGSLLYTKLQGCFYQRTGSGVDASAGNQLLLDTVITNTASTDIFNPMEIFRYTATATDFQSTRFDRSSDWDYTFCPYLSTPWEFCTLLRNGNILFWPNLTTAQKTSTLNEALLIRKQFNYVTIDKQQFESLWSNPGAEKTEADRADYRYDVTGNVDTPVLISDAWRDYLIGNRPIMPDVTSSQMPPVCYPGTQRVVLASGAVSYIHGEICYVNGVYQFTGQ